MWRIWQLSKAGLLSHCDGLISSPFCFPHIDKRISTDLVGKVMMKACKLCKPSKGLVFHSDRGSQYTSKNYSKVLVDYGIIASM
jgi:transposase InsO family protein